MNIPLATPVTLKAAGAETVSTTGLPVSGWMNVFTQPTGFLLVTVAISAVTGTPTLLVVLEGFSGAAWTELATFGVDGMRSWGNGTLPAPFTTTGSMSQLMAFYGPSLRYRSIIGGGTPSLAYSVTAQYCANPNPA